MKFPPPYNTAIYTYISACYIGIFFFTPPVSPDETVPHSHIICNLQTKHIRFKTEKGAMKAPKSKYMHFGYTPACAVIVSCRATLQAAHP